MVQKYLTDPNTRPSLARKDESGLCLTSIDLSNKVHKNEEEIAF